MNGIGGAGMSGELAIEAAGLQKSFGSVRVLDGVDLAVPRGIVFALLGPNGAGKTTTVRILATLTRADAGRARVAGHDVERERREVRRSISLAGQYAAVDGLQTGAENLRMVGRLSGLPAGQARRRADDLLTRFGLADAGSRRVGTYSGGMRRRLDLAASLTGSPSVIFLDEPTTGLDLPSRQALWQMIGDLADRGVTVFLTTQYLEKASVIMLVSGYVRTLATLESDLEATVRASGVTPDEWMAAYPRMLTKLTDPVRFPALAKFIAAGVFDRADDPDDEFIFGLERILDGIEVLFSSR